MITRTATTCYALEKRKKRLMVVSSAQIPSVSHKLATWIAFVRWVREHNGGEWIVALQELHILRGDAETELFMAILSQLGAIQ